MAPLRWDVPPGWTEHGARAFLAAVIGPLKLTTTHRSTETGLQTLETRLRVSVCACLWEMAVASPGLVGLGGVVSLKAGQLAIGRWVTSP
jgi:hypothetical protein